MLWLSIFGQVVLWFGQAKYTLYLSQGTSELKRKFLVLPYWLVRWPINAIRKCTFYYCNLYLSTQTYSSIVRVYLPVQ